MIGHAISYAPGEQARFVKSSGYFEKKGAISITYKTVLVKVRNILQLLWIWILSGPQSTYCVG
jgi:hypothetical protein